jgi:hypothetical protein
MNATVGRIVHYTDTQGFHAAAIVVDVGHPDGITLRVFHPSGEDYPVKFVAEKTPDVDGVGRWHWPERED